jgi:hypothetical protein
MCVVLYWILFYMEKRVEIDIVRSLGLALLDTLTLLPHFHNGSTLPQYRCRAMAIS